MISNLDDCSPDVIVCQMNVITTYYGRKFPSRYECGAFDLAELSFLLFFVFLNKTYEIKGQGRS